MATSATTSVEQSQQELWSGGKSPFGTSWGKLMMWIFLTSDAFTFAGLLISYGAIRFSSATWADPEQVFSAFPGFGDMHLPLMFVSLMTFILIMSSVTMVRSVQESLRKNKKGAVIWLILTIIGGSMFLGCQAWEWTHMITHGTTISGNPYGPPAFGQFFFLITGFHGFHVLSGVLINIAVCVMLAIGFFDKRGGYGIVENIGLYWHFVDLVWVFVFLAFYLI
jgi:cytochrome c oxidase subunit 3